MTTDNRQPANDNRPFSAVQRLRLLALFLVVVGARFWLLHRYASPLPVADQWDGIAWRVLQPWLDGTLGWRNLFAPHNEHRIVLTRLLSLALCALNGQWDNLLEAAVDAVFCGGSAVTLAIIFGNCLRGAFPRATLLAVAGCFVLPFGWENTLSGFQSQNYFLIYFSVLAVWGLGFHREGTARWWWGLIGAILACLSMGSGLLAAGVVLVQRGWGWWWERRWPRPGERVTASLCLAIVAAGWATRTTVPDHAALKARSLPAFLSALGRFLAWPHYEHAALGILMIAPFLLLGWMSFRQADAAAGEREADSTSLSRTGPLLAIGFWTLLQTAALAYTREAHGAAPACRYMDLLALNPLVNFLCLLVLIVRWPSLSRRVPLLVAASVWTLLVLAGLYAETAKDFTGWLPDRLAMLRRSERSLRDLVRTDDRARFRSDPEAAEFLFPSSEWLANLVADPKLQSILPYNVRLPVPLAVLGAEGSNGFVPDGYDPACGKPAGPPTWGSYGVTKPPAATFRARLVSPCGLPYLRFEFAGYLGETGLDFALRDAADSKRLSWHPAHVPKEHWRVDFLPAPNGKFVLEAVDTSAARWFAFSGPVEVGRWSYWTGFALRRSEWIVAAGLLLAAAAEILPLAGRLSRSSRGGARTASFPAQTGAEAI